MQNVAEFQIIGRVGNIDDKDKVTFLSVASNTNYQKDGEWQQRTSWNSVKGFTKSVRERMTAASKGDLVRIIGSLRQNEREIEGQKAYETELICDGFAILARKSSGDEEN